MIDTRGACLEVELIGGPFDGHVGSIPSPLPTFLVARTAESPLPYAGLRKWLHYEQPDDTQLRVAVYELCIDNGCSHYHFCRTYLMEAKAAEEWTVI